MPLEKDRYFDPNPAQREVALELYERVADLPLICPHGHVNPRLFADPDFRFGSPAELFIIPDHYIFRMLYSQGVKLEDLGIPSQDGTPVESDHRKIWQIFADHYYLFRGTPTRIWLDYEFETLFDVHETLNSDNAQAIYDKIDAVLREPEFTPRQLYHRFNVEVLCTTDAAADSLDDHQAIRDSDWDGRILPTFRPDAVVNIDTENWKQNIDDLSAASGVEVSDYHSFIQALEQRRAFFKEMGAKATDHAALTALTLELSDHDAEAIFQRALLGEASEADATRFTAHMLVEMARMSSEDGLVMQMHIGSLRNHNPAVFERFGRDKGADIPVPAGYTRELMPLLNAHGNDPNFRLVLFTLDETTYSRELAPLAGHYPTLVLGPPWWFHDSLNGMARFFEQVTETAGIYNTAGFNDDTRAFPSIPARHDVWRRAACNWLAGLVVRKIIDRNDAHEMARSLAYELAKETYNL
jgi:glucuronate isomerase